MDFPEITFRLPHWVEDFLADFPSMYETAQDRMNLAIALASENVYQGSGGPFGAAVFEADTGRLVSVGVNLVIPCRCSCAHAEVIALSLAQQGFGTHNLGRAALPMELVSSVEPCTMCLGAVIWSGVRSLVCGARDEDARRVGFDEGPKPLHWPQELNQRGITVTRDVCREQAVEVLQRYLEKGGQIYNGREN
jgi:tRNA(Arg) A34 adenosine deaminase TadA